MKEKIKKKKKKNEVGPSEMFEEEHNPNINLRKSNFKIKSSEGKPSSPLSQGRY
jgi:hypothetical protein